jgi:hypothetical protein
MTPYESIMGLAIPVIKSFFFIFPSKGSYDPFYDIPNKNSELEKWLDDDEISKEDIKNPRNKRYLKELEQLKDEFRNVYYGKVLNITRENKNVTVHELLTLILANKVQIARLRFVISPETFINIHEHPMTGYKYSVMRSYWISDNLKKIKKYSYNIGNVEKLSKSDYDNQLKEGYNSLKDSLEEAYDSLYKK